MLLYPIPSEEAHRVMSPLRRGDDGAAGFPPKLWVGTDRPRNWGLGRTACSVWRPWPGPEPPRGLEALMSSLPGFISLFIGKIYNITFITLTILKCTVQ